MIDTITFELCDQISIDTLTGRCAERSVYIKSGNRRIFISEESVRRMAEILRIDVKKVNGKT